MRSLHRALSALAIIGALACTSARADEEGLDLLAVGPRDVELTTEDDVTIASTFYPADGSLPPAVILVAEPGGGRDAWGALASELSARGVAVLAIDMRELGESNGAVASQLPNDIRAGIRFLREREDIDGVRVALVGAGTGANAAAAYSVDDHLLVGLGLLSPLVSSHGLDAGEAIHGYGSRPSLLIAAEGDLASASALSVLEERAQGEVRVARISGSASGVRLLASFKARAAVLEWLDGIFANP